MSLWFHRLDKITNEIISEFLPWNFLEAFWAFLQASLFIILHTKSPGSPKSFHEAPRKLQKKLRAEIQKYFVGIFVQTMKPKGHFEINWPLMITFTNLVNRESHIFKKVSWGQTVVWLILNPKSYAKLKNLINRKPTNVWKCNKQSDD